MLAAEVANQTVNNEQFITEEVLAEMFFVIVYWRFLRMFVHYILGLVQNHSRVAIQVK